jgi:hypothetical protein
VVVKTYYQIQKRKIFSACIVVEILTEWDVNLVGTTGFAYVKGAIQKPGSSQACHETFGLYSYSYAFFFLTMQGPVTVEDDKPHHTVTLVEFLRDSCVSERLS